MIAHGSRWSEGRSSPKRFVAAALAATAALSAGMSIAPGAGAQDGAHSAGRLSLRPALEPAPTPAPFRPGVVLVGFRPGVTVGERYAIERAAGGDGARHLGPLIRPAGHGPVTGQEFLEPLKLQVPAAQVLAVVRRLRRSRAVAYAEPDYLMQAQRGRPNDPSFPLQWGVGQHRAERSHPGSRRGPRPARQRHSRRRRRRSEGVGH